MGRAKIIFPATHLHDLLNLAPDVRVVGAIAETDPLCVQILVEGDRFPPGHPDEESTIVTLPACQERPRR